jgi:hypothetical protein
METTVAVRRRHTIEREEADMKPFGIAGIVAAAAIASTAGSAAAGEIYGTVTEGGKAVKAGTRIEVRCGDAVHGTETGKDGAYRLFVPEQGKCTLTVKTGGAAPSTTIHSFEDSARFVLSVEKADGKAVLRSK